MCDILNIHTGSITGNTTTASWILGHKVQTAISSSILSYSTVGTDSTPLLPSLHVNGVKAYRIVAKTSQLDPNKELSNGGRKPMLLFAGKLIFFRTNFKPCYSVISVGGPFSGLRMHQFRLLFYLTTVEHDAEVVGCAIEMMNVFYAEASLHTLSLRELRKSVE